MTFKTWLEQKQALMLKQEPCGFDVLTVTEIDLAEEAWDAAMEEAATEISDAACLLEDLQSEVEDCPWCVGKHAADCPWGDFLSRHPTASAATRPLQEEAPGDGTLAFRNSSPTSSACAVPGESVGREE
jgi:hypothetical protein